MKLLYKLILLTATIGFVGCSNDPSLQIFFHAGSSASMGINQPVQMWANVSDASGGTITYLWSKDGSSFDTIVGDQNAPTYTYTSAGTYTIQCWALDGSTWLNASQTITITGSGGDGTNTGTLPDDGTPADLYIHSNITASTFWAGEGASGANHDISNVPSAWDNTWGDKFGVEDWPNLARDGNYIPTDSRYKKKENPYYFALPYNDYDDVVYDGSYNQNNVANLQGDYSTVYNADYSRNIVTTNLMGWLYDGQRKSSVSNIPWKNGDGSAFWTWGGKSMVKGRWARLRHNGGAWVYAQWMDAGPYHYDDVPYVFGTSAPRNASSSTGASPNAGIDLSPSVMKRMGVQLSDQGANIQGVEWQFVNAKDVPEGPWRLYVSNNLTDW